jgi:predicted DsbA family dithiol-disulfide isomerase
MSDVIQVAIDVICPWCFIGKRTLDQALSSSKERDRYGIEWLPYELDPEMPVEGQDRLSYRTKRFGSIERSKEMDRKATIAGHRVGIAFRYDLMSKTPNTLNAHRLIWWAGGLGGSLNELVDAIFRAYFLEGRDIGDLQTLVEIAESAGFPRGEVSAFLKSEDATAKVHGLEAWVKAQEVNSVPAYFLNQERLADGPDSLFAMIKGKNRSAYTVVS